MSHHVKLALKMRTARQTCCVNNSTAQVYCQYLKYVLDKHLFINITISGMENMVLDIVVNLFIAKNVYINEEISISFVTMCSHVIVCCLALKEHAGLFDLAKTSYCDDEIVMIPGESIK